jgi:hypothetical protein
MRGLWAKRHISIMGNALPMLRMKSAVVLHLRAKRVA